MNLALLSGNGSRGKEWLTQVGSVLSPQFDHTYHHSYKHWETEEPEIDLDLEIERLAHSVSGLSPYIVFAKSAGTMVTSKAVTERSLYPKASLFVGLPLIMIKDHNLPADEWLRAIDFPVVILQHTSDPFGSCKEVEMFIEKANNSSISVQELPGDSHDYTEFQIFKNVAVNLSK